MQAWKHDHRGKKKGQEYCSDSAKKKIETSCEVYQESYGATRDPVQEPIDLVVVMKAGGGKKSDRHYLFDGSISTSSHPQLSQLREQSTSSSASIRSCPTASASQFAQL